MVPVEGVETPIHRLRSDCSTTELHRLLGPTIALLTLLLHREPVVFKRDSRTDPLITNYEVDLLDHVGQGRL